MQMDLEELLTSSQGDSPASRGQSQELKAGTKMTVTSGQKWLPLLKTYNLSGSLAKMSEALLTNPWACPRTLTDLEGIGYQVVTFVIPARLVAHPTKETGDCCRCWREAVVAHTRHGSGWDIGSAETGQDAQAERIPHHNQTARPSGEPSPVADTDSTGRKEQVKWGLNLAQVK